LMTLYDDHRFRQQRPDQITLDTIEYIRTEPLVKAVLTGHLHFNHQAKLTESIPQVLVGCTDIRVITIK